jgi:hypothetical protein
LQESVERFELSPPERAMRRQPVLRRGEARFVEPARAHAADLDRRHELRALEHAHVLHERGKRDRVIRGQRRHGRRSAAQPVEDGAAHRIGERGEREIERLILNHWVNY